MSRKFTYEEVKQYIEEKGYFLITNEYKDNISKLLLIDSEGYYYYTNISDLKNNRNPLKVYKSNPYSIQNIKLWLKLNYKDFELCDNQIYQRDNIKLDWFCLKTNCQEIFKATWNDIKNNHNCPFCSGQQVGLSNCLATKNPELAKEWHPTLNGDLTPYDVTSGHNKYVWWICNNNHEWQAKVTNRNNGANCPYCSGRYATKENNLLVINPKLCEEWDYNKNDKLPEEYCPNSGKKVWWICKECGNNWQSNILNRNNGRGCPTCRESQGEKRVVYWLKENNISFKSQYIFEDLISRKRKNLRFDFGILDNNKLILLIEYDGEQHYKWIKGMMSKENFKTLQYHDNLKNEYCLKNNIPLLRIPYWDFDNIEDILENNLLLMNK